MGVKIDQGVTGAQDARDFLIASRDLLLSKIIEREGLGAREDMCRPVIPLERFGNGVLIRFDAIVPRRGSGLRIAFSRHNCTDNAHPRHTRHITHDVVQVEIHLIQRLLHVLNMFDRHLDEIVSMAEETAELADVLRRAKRRRQ